MGDEAVDAEEHFARKTRLPREAVDCELEVQVLHLAAQLCERYEQRGDGRRAVERLGRFPRQPAGDGLALEVAGREVDAQTYLVVVAVGETLFDALPDAVDPHHEFALVVHLLREAGNVEGIVVAQQRRVGFEEPDRSGGACGAAARSAGQFVDVRRVVAADADDFHGSSNAMVV